MRSIFVKSCSAVLPNGLPVLPENVAAKEISGGNAEKILKIFEDLLDGEKEFSYQASSNVFAEEFVKIQEVFDIFESEGIDDDTPYYRIWKDEWCEGQSFEIYCQPGKSLRIIKLDPEKP